MGKHDNRPFSLYNHISGKVASKTGIKNDEKNSKTGQNWRGFCRNTGGFLPEYGQQTQCQLETGLNRLILISAGSVLGGFLPE